MYRIEESNEDEAETNSLLAIPGMLTSLQEGMKTPIDDCEEKLDW